jgi:pimeloyl-ACP methyl ester carboxylesterase
MSVLPVVPPLFNYPKGANQGRRRNVPKFKGIRIDLTWVGPRLIFKKSVFDAPALILHGGDDQTLPIGAAHPASAKFVQNATLKVTPAQIMA